MTYHFELDLSGPAIGLLHEALQRYGADPALGTAGHELKNLENELSAAMQHIVADGRLAAQTRADNADLL